LVLNLLADPRAHRTAQERCALDNASALIEGRPVTRRLFSLYDYRMKEKGRTIPKRARELIGDLRHLFPEPAALLIMQLAVANADAKKLPKWRQEQLESLMTMLGLSATDLEQAYLERRITKLAWATRNLLELSVWVDHCNLSDTNARHFRDDAMRDLYGLSRAVQRSIEVESSANDSVLERKLAELATFAQSMGVQALGDDFTRVSDAAQALGRQPAFGSTNKLLSKFAHPTAWAVHTVTSAEADEGYRLMFLADGVAFAINSLIAIRKFVREYYPQIAMTEKEAAI